MDPSAIESLTQEIGRALHERVRAQPPPFYAGMRADLLRRAVSDPRLRAALFQFVDVLPQLTDNAAIARHFRAYLGDFELGGLFGRLLRLGENRMAAPLVRQTVSRLARLFLVEETPRAFAAAMRKIAALPAMVSLDAVGEAVLSGTESDHYAARILKLLDWLKAHPTRRPDLSIKLSALTPRFDPIDPEGGVGRVMTRIEPIRTAAAAAGVSLTLDMESHDTKPLVLAVHRHLLEKEGVAPGIALQAYSPETERDLAELLEFARGKDRRLRIRLVKGAYWDSEVAWSEQRGWPCPVYTDKPDTDVLYERLTARLFEQGDRVYPMLASHNLRSLARTLALARAYGRPDDAWETQLLYGMAEPLGAGLRAEGAAVRLYVPVGDLLGGIAYLIRRLMENTASTSVIRQEYLEEAGLEQLLAAPACSGARAPAVVTGPSTGLRTGFSNEPVLDFGSEQNRRALRTALKTARAGLGGDYPLPGGIDAPSNWAESRNPARSAEILGRVELAGGERAERTLAAAAAAFPDWRDTPVAERGRLCRRAADLIRDRRFDLAAWQVLEVGKNWREADADVAEAIDYWRYYADNMERLAGWRETRDFSGERNALVYEPLGPALIIAPWNFPLAILSGMTAAALAGGNPAIMKPAGSARINAHLLHAVLMDAGFPPDVVQLLPGEGATVGRQLASHPDTAIVAFTGSREVGMSLLELAHRRHPEQKRVKRVVCEMGGKNAIVVDEDADLDEAVAQILASAFGYQGQKCSACSRLIAVGRVHDRLLSRLADAISSYPLGPPEDPQYLFGPLVSQAALDKANRYLEIGRREGRLYWQGNAPEGGWYFAPAIFCGIRPDHRLAREEIFAPILAVMRAPDFPSALEMALDSEYALTGGVFSRMPEHLRLAQADYRVGNLYLNRKITGARVGVQPFGGTRLSGTGIQAGGEDYLKQFLATRVVSVNTQRHGFVP